jgi:hypothetical protein
MPQNDDVYTYGMFLLNFEAWHGFHGRNFGRIEVAAESNISPQYVQKFFAECGCAHFTRKFSHRFGSCDWFSAGIGNETVRAGAGESALLARDAWCRLG